MREKGRNFCEKFEGGNFMVKKYELRIARTYVIMLAIGIIINELWNVVAMSASFFTAKVILDGLFFGLFYLFLVWINTRKYQVLTYVGVLSVLLLLPALGVGQIIGAELDTEFTVGKLLVALVRIIYFGVAAVLATFQSYKLLEEEQEDIS